MATENNEPRALSAALSAPAMTTRAGRLAAHVADRHVERWAPETSTTRSRPLQNLGFVDRTIAPWIETAQRSASLRLFSQYRAEGMGQRQPNDVSWVFPRPWYQDELDWMAAAREAPGTTSNATMFTTRGTYVAPAPQQASPAALPASLYEFIAPSLSVAQPTTQAQGIGYGGSDAYSPLVPLAAVQAAEVMNRVSPMARQTPALRNVLSTMLERTAREQQPSRVSMQAPEMVTPPAPRDDRFEAAPSEAMQLAERYATERAQIAEVQRLARVAAEREMAARMETARAQLAAQTPSSEVAVRERVEASRGEAARVEAARVEAARVEATREAAARMESAREAARVEAARIEATRLEAVRAEAARIAESTGVDIATATPQAMRAEVARRAEAAREAARVDAGNQVDVARDTAARQAETSRRQEAVARAEAARQEAAARLEAVALRQEAARVAVQQSSAQQSSASSTQQSSTQQSTQQAAAQQAAAQQAAARQGSTPDAGSEAARSEAARSEAARAETARAEVARAEAARIERARVEERIAQRLAERTGAQRLHEQSRASAAAHARMESERVVGARPEAAVEAPIASQAPAEVMAAIAALPPELAAFIGQRPGGAIAAIDELNDALRTVELMSRAAASGDTFAPSRGPRLVMPAGLGGLVAAIDRAHSIEPAAMQRGPGLVPLRLAQMSAGETQPALASMASSSMAAATRVPTMSWLSAPTARTIGSFGSVAGEAPTTAFEATTTATPAALTHVAWADRWLARFAGASQQSLDTFTAAGAWSPSARMQALAASAPSSVFVAPVFDTERSGESVRFDGAGHAVVSSARAASPAMPTISTPMISTPMPTITQEAWTSASPQAREAMRAEIARAETARIEALRAEATRMEMAGVEQSRVEALRNEASRLEVVSQQAAREESAQQARAAVEAARAEVARLEAARVEAARIEAARAEVTRLEAAAEAPQFVSDQVVRFADDAETPDEVFAAISASVSRGRTPAATAQRASAPQAGAPLTAMPTPTPSPMVTVDRYTAADAVAHSAPNAPGAGFAAGLASSPFAPALRHVLPLPSAPGFDVRALFGGGLSATYLAGLLGSSTNELETISRLSPSWASWGAEPIGMAPIGGERAVPGFEQTFVAPDALDEVSPEAVAAMTTEERAQLAATRVQLEDARAQLEAIAPATTTAAASMPVTTMRSALLSWDVEATAAGPTFMPSAESPSFAETTIARRAGSPITTSTARTMLSSMSMPMLGDVASPDDDHAAAWTAPGMVADRAHSWSVAQERSSADLSFDFVPPELVLAARVYGLGPAEAAQAARLALAGPGHLTAMAGTVDRTFVQAMAIEAVGSPGTELEFAL